MTFATTLRRVLPRLLVVGTLALAGAAGAATIRTIAGTGNAGYAGDGGHGNLATLRAPISITASPGTLYVADAGNHAIRAMSLFGARIATVAGDGTPGFSGDGNPATAAQLNSPADVFITSAGVIYVTDTGNHRVRSFTVGGNITTVAGDGTAGYGGDGDDATTASLSSPTGVCVAGDSLYIADRGNHRIRVVNLTTDRITTFAGKGIAGFAGDGGDADSALFDSPTDVYVDPAGEILYIADSGNHRIRAVNLAGNTITTVAGNGSSGYAGDGSLAVNAQLSFPRSVYVDTTGSVYIADRFNHRLRRVNPSGGIATLVGDGGRGHTGDQIAANRARLAAPTGVVVVGRRLFVVDSENHRVRSIEADDQTPLVGVTTASPESEVRLFGMTFTGDGTTGVKGVKLTLSDLTTPTGIDTADFTEFRLYESDDVQLSADDRRLGTLAASEITLDAPFQVQAQLSSVPRIDEERHYLLSAVMSPGAREAHAFRVWFPTGGLQTTLGGQGLDVAADDGNHVLIDIVASRLLFATQPDGIRSGNPILTPPVLRAVDNLGYLDTDFAAGVTLTVGGGAGGTLLQAAATANSGIVTFPGLTYIAADDDELLRLIATGGGLTDSSNVVRANASNDPPVVSVLAFRIDEDDSATVAVTDMISDADDSLSALDIRLSATNADLRLTGSTLVIQPRRDFHGLDTLRIEVVDPFGGTAADEAPLTIRSVNDRPELLPLGSRIVDEDDTLVVDLIAHISDVETVFADLAISLVPSAGLSTRFDAETGELQAWSAPDTSGTFVLTTTGVDADQAQETRADTIAIVPVNDPPVLSPPTGLQMAHDSTLVLDLASLTSDVDNDRSDLTWSADGAHGLDAVVGDTARITAQALFDGDGWLLLRATDPDGGADVDTLFVRVLPAPPQPPVLAGLPIGLTVEAGDTLRLDLLSLVTDPDDAVEDLRWTVTEPDRGAAKVEAGTLVLATVRPDAYEVELRIEVRDADDQVDSATLTVGVTEEIPLLAAFPDTLVIDRKGRQLDLDVYIRDDTEASLVSWTAVADGDLEVVIDAERRTVSIAPSESSRAGGIVTFVATAGPRSGTGTVDVEILNLPPRVEAPALFLTGGETATLPLDGFATDDDDVSLLRWSVRSPDTRISAQVIQEARSVTLTADETALGEVALELTATDKGDASGVGVLLVTVLAPLEPDDGDDSGGGDDDNSPPRSAPSPPSR